MKKILLACAFTVAINTVAATELKTDAQRISYAIGAQIGASLADAANGPIKLDKQAVFDAMSDVLDNKKLQLTPEKMAEVMKLFREKSEQYAAKKLAALSKANTEEGKQFLDNNKTKDGVKVTDSGLQYRVIEAGQGKKPKATNTVKVHYKGTLPNGDVFDSSYQRGKPAEFPLDAVIAGWTEGLQLMPVGSKYELVIPANLAYGKMAPPAIGPERVLIFEVELLDIVK